MRVDQGGAHVFRRSCATWLRKQKTIRVWLGHDQTSVTDLYVNLDKDMVWRKKEAEGVGVGFTLPTSVIPNVPKIREAGAVEIAA